MAFYLLGNRSKGSFFREYHDWIMTFEKSTLVLVWRICHCGVPAGLGWGLREGSAGSLIQASIDDKLT